MTTKHPLSSVSRPDTALSLEDVGLLFSDNQENFELSRNEIGAALQSFPSYQHPVDQLYVADTSIAPERHSSSASLIRNIMRTNTSVNRPLEAKQILSRSTSGTSGIVKIDRGIHTSMKVSKKPGRKGKLLEKQRVKASIIREKKACASCFASHVEVGYNRCHRHPDFIDSDESVPREIPASDA